MIRSIKYKLNLNDGTVEKRWTHIPDGLYDEPVGDPCCTICDYPEDDDPEREEKIGDINYKLWDICTDYAYWNFRGKVQPVLDGPEDSDSSCWDWVNMVYDFQFKLYLVKNK